MCSSCTWGTSAQSSGAAHHMWSLSVFSKLFTFWPTKYPWWRLVTPNGTDLSTRILSIFQINKGLLTIQTCFTTILFVIFLLFLYKLLKIFYITNLFFLLIWFLEISCWFTTHSWVTTPTLGTTGLCHSIGWLWHNDDSEVNNSERSSSLQRAIYSSLVLCEESSPKAARLKKE